MISVLFSEPLSRARLKTLQLNSALASRAQRNSESESESEGCEGESRVRQGRIDANKDRELELQVVDGIPRIRESEVFRGVKEQRARKNDKGIL